jgi:hypothetical protein
MDQQMLMLNVKYKRDFRPDLTVALELPKLDLMGIDEKLYEKEHETLVGYEPGEEVDVRVLGINFKLIKKEEG